MAGLALLLCVLAVYGLMVAMAVIDHRSKRWRRRRQRQRRKAPVRYRIRALRRLVVFLVRIPISPILVMWRILERGALAINSAEVAFQGWRRRRQAAKVWRQFQKDGVDWNIEFDKRP
jgi:hypothetical protein